MQLPKRPEPATIIEEVDTATDWSAADDDESDSNDDSEDNDATPWSRRFGDLCSCINAAIQQLGGNVAPKTNWSSPTDATWINICNSLSCTNADEVCSGFRVLSPACLPHHTRQLKLCLGTPQALI